MEKDLKLDFDLEKFRNLSEEEIAEKFNKEILPEIIKKIRQGGAAAGEAECGVCNPWSYSVF